MLFHYLRKQETQELYQNTEACSFYEELSVNIYLMSLVTCYHLVTVEPKSVDVY